MVPLRDIPVGKRFQLVKTPPHGSTILEKIEPEPIKPPNAPKEVEALLFFNAVWVDGPHAGLKACIPEGEKKNTYMVIAVD